jgi:hypothetical protein
MIARDGKTVINDANAFGQEWQLRDTEPILPDRSSPQHPNVCTMPTPCRPVRRRLLETSSVDEACCGKGLRTLRAAGKDDCV